MKDKEWLKEEIDELFHAACEIGKMEYHEADQSVYVINELIDQLDEPEFLSQKWIDENKVARIDNLRKMTTSDVVPVEKLKKLLVPKKEELEVKIQELIEAYKQEDGQYSNPENYWIDTFISNLESLLENKRYVVIDNKGSYILAKIKGEIMPIGEILEFYGHESVVIDYNLTEQEIKDYDKRFWAFAEEVTE